MNILIPHSWLLEHLETTAKPEEIQKYLSLCGPSVERIYQREGESVYDIEITTNRVDSMSVRGIAREAAVILPQFGIKASLKPLKLPELAGISATNNLPQPKVINDPNLCKRIMYVMLQDVQRTATPDWMAKRLLQTEMNVHDSVIDITNYITHELGHPCHAFDYDKIMATGGEIIVKEASKGKKFTTLDGMAYETVGGEVVFENPKGEIIDFPAIKGTANTSISSSTKNVLLWIESLEPKKVRFGSMTHAIRTTAAQLNEKDVDPQLGEDVLARGLELYQQLCHAEVASPVYDDFSRPRKLQPISVTLAYLTTILGVAVAPEKIQHILQVLGCEVTLEKNQTLLVQPPSFRPDIEIPADVAEEIARIYGYHNLPSVIMETAIPLVKPEGLDLALENKVKHFLANIGWQEVYTYSLVSQELATESDFPLAAHLKLQNPLTDDKVYLRRSLLPSLKEILLQNSQASDLAVFELAYAYHPQANDLPEHELLLSFVSKGNYREVRGQLEALTDHLFISDFKIIPQKNTHALLQSSAEISAKNHAGKVITLGLIGITAEGWIAGEIIVNALSQVRHTYPTYQPISKTMPVIEDLTFTLPNHVKVGDVIASIKNTSALITKVELKDVYQRNFTFSLSYQDAETNVDMQIVEKVRKNIVAALAKEHDANLVGSLK